MLFVVLAGLVVASPGAHAGDPTGADWPQWGGPRRDFVARPGYAGPWPESPPRERWRRRLGTGYSGIAVRDGRLFTMYRRDGQEVVIALDAESGRTLWEHAYAAPVYVDQVKDFGKGPNATPLVAAGNVYTVGFTSRLVCLDARDGTPRWSHDLVEEYGGRIQPFGHAASPLRHGEMVIVLVGGERHGALGFDLRDGSVVWRSEPLEFSYASPLVAKVGGEDQLVFMTPKSVVGIGLADGRLRFEHPHENKYGTNCQGPWWGDDDLLFVSAHANAGSRTLRLTRDGAATRVEEVRRNEELRIFHGSAARVGRRVYGVSESRLFAYELRSGEEEWSRPGFPDASVVYVDGKLVLLDDAGKLTLAQLVERGVDVRASVDVLGKPAWTAPSVVGTALFARDTENVVALDLVPGDVAKGGP
jgi:outer membrane protein assembly factor BamB